MMAAVRVSVEIQEHPPASAVVRARYAVPIIAVILVESALPTRTAMLRGNAKAVASISAINARVVANVAVMDAEAHAAHVVLAKPVLKACVFQTAEAGQIVPPGVGTMAAARSRIKIMSPSPGRT